MTFDVSNETAADFSFDFEETAKRLILAVIDYVECPYECELSLTLAGNDGIREINREFRNIDAPTDVLSFPLVDFSEPCSFSFLEAGRGDCFNPDTGELMLGDIVICADRVKSQAEEYGHSELREYGFLIVHSMLHLFGYDHMDDGERGIMEQKQREILDKAGLVR